MDNNYNGFDQNGSDSQPGQPCGRYSPRYWQNGNPENLQNSNEYGCGNAAQPYGQPVQDDPYAYPPSWQYQSPELRQRKRYEKKSVRFLSICAGMGILGFVVTQNLFSVILSRLKLTDLYYESALFENCVGIFMSVLCILVPFAVVWSCQRKRTPDVEYFQLSKPVDMKLFLLAIPAGFALCILGNHVTALVQLLFSSLGFELTSPYIASPDTVFETVMYYLRITVVAAITEETAMRGVVLQPLRKYGNGFAVVMSALVFGLMHGNLIQAPFAFVAGLGLGYFAVATQSLWAPLAIHLINNLFSLVVSRLGESLPNEVYASVYNISSVVIVATGAVCFYFFCRRRGGHALPASDTVLTKGEKARAYIFTVPMVTALLLMIATTLMFVTHSGA